MIKMYFVGSFNFEQRKGFYTKIAKIMIWVEIGWIGCLPGKSKGAPRIFFLYYIIIFIVFFLNMKPLHFWHILALAGVINILISYFLQFQWQPCL